MKRPGNFRSIHRHGFVRVGVGTPAASAGDVGANADALIALALRAGGEAADLLVLPELAPAEGGDGRIALTFEVVYGHAFKPVPRVSLSAESAVSLREMRSMLQRGRPGA